MISIVINTILYTRNLSNKKASTDAERNTTQDGDSITPSDGQTYLLANEAANTWIPGTLNYPKKSKN